MIATSYRRGFLVHKTEAIDAQGWLIGADKVPSPNCNERPAGAEVSLLVVHNISLPPNQFGGDYVKQFFCNGLDCTAHPYFSEIAEMQVSAHCLVDRQGQVTQFVSFDDRAWHAGASVFGGQENCNDFSIGVELEGADHIPFEQVQYAVLAELTHQLMARYPAITPTRIVGHSDIAPGRKTDPGPAFDWQCYLALITDSTTTQCR